MGPVESSTKDSGNMQMVLSPLSVEKLATEDQHGCASERLVKKPQKLHKHRVELHVRISWLLQGEYPPQTHGEHHEV